VPTGEAKTALETAQDDGRIDRKPAGPTVVWVPADGGALTPDLTEDEVEDEVDALVEDLDLDASLRVFAQGLVGDTVEALDVANPDEIAGAILLAALRIQDEDVDGDDVAEAGDFEARVLYTWLEAVADVVDVEVPQPGPAEFVDRLVEALDLDGDAEEEIRQVLEQFAESGEETEFAAIDLAAGATSFVATISDADVDAGDVSDASGADVEYVTDAMTSILIALCCALVDGSVEYDDSPWSADLLDSDLGVEDETARRALALAKTYVAGRESEGVDNAAIDTLLGVED